MYGCDEAISEFGKSLEEARLFDIVFQGGANLADGEVQAMLKIDKGLRSPNTFGKFRPAYDVARARNEQNQDFGGLGLQFDADSIVAEFSGVEIKLEAFEDGNHS